APRRRAFRAGTGRLGRPARRRRHAHRQRPQADALHHASPRKPPPEPGSTGSPPRTGRRWRHRGLNRIARASFGRSWLGPGGTEAPLPRRPRAQAATILGRPSFGRPTTGHSSFDGDPLAVVIADAVDQLVVRVETCLIRTTL